MSSRRICLALDLNDDPALIAEYERMHEVRNAWPEVVRSIRDAGIIEMEIYRTGDRLFMIMDVTDAYDPAAKAKADKANPKVAEWEALMERFQQRLSWAAPDEKWVRMDVIYRLTDTAAVIESPDVATG